ncbi:MAG: SCP2 sterol-binding domain-containing protein [Gammaproteobacteria bacterium]
MSFLGQRLPQLPRPLVAPLALIPGVIHSTILTATLNRAFRELLDAGDLDFLEDQVLSVRVLDARIEYRMRLSARYFVPCSKASVPSLTIAGTVYDLLSLVTRREDSDTLFFNRRLILEGDTALGLQLKNMLDGLEVPATLQPVIQGFDKFLGFYERIARPYA